jgi:osomolarity two-component system sensor histidine kinase NIK1
VACSISTEAGDIPRLARRRRIRGATSTSTTAFHRRLLETSQSTTLDISVSLYGLQRDLGAGAISMNLNWFSFRTTTMPDDVTLGAVTAILHNLANSSSYLSQHSGLSSPPIDVADSPSQSSKIDLPGQDSIAKQALEKELASLAARIRFLESRADGAHNHFLPDTPNENGLVASPFEGSNGKPPRHAYMAPRTQSLPRDRGSTLLNSILSGRDGRQNGNQQAVVQLSESDLGLLRDHVSSQAERIQDQKDQLAALSEDLTTQTDKTREAIGNVEVSEATRVQNLERELKKNQQANEAFQKVLREIGGIVTAVARGDLSQKVLIHSMEIDPEITTFKRTINTMMDQLQVFASEVSRVAREVGTEGRLGGQAQISGVDGTWRELTENGMLRADIGR